MNQSSTYWGISLACALIALACRHVKAPAWLPNALLLVVLCIGIVQTARSGQGVSMALACAGTAVLAWWLVRGLCFLARHRQSIAHALGRWVGRIRRRFR